MLCWGESGFEPGLDSQTLSVLQGQRVQHLCSRPGFTVFVLENGKVFTRRSQQTKPGPLAQFKEHKIHFADSGTSHILFLSEAGHVFLSEVKSKESAAKLKEFSIMKPQSFKSLSEINVVQVACGNNHSLALSKDGRLFAWGQNTYGQLGLDTKDPSQCKPQCVDELSGIPVAQITAGGEHSFALSLSGAVFGWGRNNHGQLGLKDTEDRRKPNHVKLLECKKTIHVSCGEEHTAVLSKDGLVFTFGAGSYGQLGHNSTKDEIKPRLVGDLFGIKVSQIACGSYHTLVFVPSSGKIYSFGRGDKGQLGKAQTSHQSVPLLVNLMGTSGNNGPENGRTTKPAVRRIFAGGNQGFAAFCDEADSESSIDQSSLIPLKGILTLDNLLEMKLCKNTRKAIIRAFSSSQTLNASFLDVSKDGHFKTSGGVSAPDMSAVRRSFKKLAENSVMLQQVTDAVQKHLIPSLPRSPAGVEALRVYLILPELIAVLKEPNDLTLLTECLNRAILSLEERHFKILECWWSTIHHSALKRLVGLYQKESERRLLLAMEVISNNNSKLHDSLIILQALYKVNSSRYRKIPEKHFCIPVMKMFKDSLMARAVRLFPGAHQSDYVQFINEIMEGLFPPQDQQFARFNQYFIGLRKFQEQLIPYPCIFDMETKLNALNLETKIIENRGYLFQSVLQMQVSRGAILQDALECLRSVRSAAPYPALQVRFVNEPCSGHGVSQEFFTLFSRELQNSKKLFQRADSGLLWFPTWEPEMADVFHLVGIVCGLAVSNGFVSNFRFPLALYKKLLRVQPTLEDLKELLPEEGKSLQYILDYEYDDIEDVLVQNFTITRETSDGHKVKEELIQDGTNTPVQKHNRKQFVDAYVDYKFNTSVEKQFEAFSQGFRSSFTLPLVDVFLPDELRAVIHGSNKYDWELLEQNAKYCGYAHTDKAVRNFWKTFENLPEEKKKQFLEFLSGSELIPAGGIGSLRIIILNTRSAEPDSSYPRAYTCTRTLDLPNYSNREILREKLLHAIEFSKEFNAQPP